MRYENAKRIPDVVVAISLGILFLPFWLFVPLAILIDSGRPVLFRHKRLGFMGKEFELFKFRSMVQNADALLHSHDAELLAQFKNGDWKIANDPRITKLGKLLRSLTIDEFPQLYNVLKGEMSMVGPRAYLKSELLEQSNKYPETKAFIPYIISVKPGITGPWQVSGRNDVPFPQRARMDAEYAQRQSLWHDIEILLQTPKAMISKW